MEVDQGKEIGDVEESFIELLPNEVGDLDDLKPHKSNERFPV